MSWVRLARVCVRRVRSGVILSALALVFIPSSAFAASANVKFSIPGDGDVDFFRIYVGVQSKAYDTRFEIRQPALGAGGQAMAMQEQLATVLTQPRVFFLAMTTVDLRGQESAFSNEIMIDLRGGDGDADGVLDRLDNCPRTANRDQLDRGGVANPTDVQGLRRDGIGDRCQCGDVDASGTVTVRDAQVIEMMSVVGGVMNLAGGTNAQTPATCNVAGGPGCDAADAQAIRAAVAGRAQLEQVCLAATRQTSAEAIVNALVGQCPAADRGENKDPNLIKFCNDLRAAIVQAVVRALAAQCPGVALGTVKDPVIASFCRELARGLAGGR